MESVPNFSEGRRPEIVDRIVGVARAVDGVRVLDVHSDEDHNRTVLTLAGESEPLKDAVYRSIATATDLIDLREHTGEHPRLGATDVVPFIPIGNTTMGEAVAAARETNFKMQHFGAVLGYLPRWEGERSTVKAREERRAATTACPLCDGGGYIQLKSTTGAFRAIECPHDQAKIAAFEDGIRLARAGARV